MPRIFLDSSLKVLTQDRLLAGLETIFQQLEDQTNAGAQIITLDNANQTLPQGMVKGDLVFNIANGELRGGIFNGITVVYTSFGSFVGAITDSQHGTRSGGTLHALVTTLVAGFMSAADKTALDGLVTNGAAKLTTARLINGSSFDGTADIIVSNLQFFGNGSDGALAAGFGTITLTQDRFYSSITFNATDKIVTAGYKVFCSGIVDMSNAGASAIVAGTNPNGGNAAGSTPGVAPTSVIPGTVSNGGTGTIGKTGGTGVGVAGFATFFGANGNGGRGGFSGAGGAGTAGAGGAGAINTAPTSFLSLLRADVHLIRGTGLTGGATAGSTGGSGAGTGSLAGGGSGATGNGGSVGALFFATLQRAGTTAASAIFYGGGSGGNGGNSPNPAAGGGGGSGGGGGGWIYLLVGKLLGSAATNMLDTSGGASGNGGTGNTTGVGGGGASGGNGGRITVINISANTAVETDNTAVAGTAGTAAVGTVAGTGGAGAVSKVTL